MREGLVPATIPVGQRSQIVRDVGLAFEVTERFVQLQRLRSVRLQFVATDQHTGHEDHVVGASECRHLVAPFSQLYRIERRTSRLVRSHLT